MRKKKSSDSVSTKTLIQTENSKKQSENTKKPHRNLRLYNDCGPNKNGNPKR